VAKSKDVHRITGVAVGLTEDQSARQRRYFISMMLRTACFILTVVVPNPWRWFFFVGAFILPYVAVVVANAGRERGIANPSAVQVRELN